MAATQAFAFTSSDGLALTGRITRPTAAGETPLIVVVGPGINGAAPTDFNNVAQFFASKGYATAYVNHRGTIGFGRDFAVAGDLQIASGMGRDLVEGVKWLGDQGWIDPQRVALFADSSGGLIALPLATKAGPFRALVNFGTPLDISDWEPVSFLRRANRSSDELMAAAGGKKNFETYRDSLAPLTVAAQISIPSFHYYSRLSDGVIPRNVNKLEALLKKNGHVYQLVVSDDISEWDVRKKGNYPEWRETARHLDEIAAFLQKNL